MGTGGSCFLLCSPPHSKPYHSLSLLPALSPEPLARPDHSSESQSLGQWRPLWQLSPPGQVALQGAFALSQQLPSPRVTQLPRHSLAQQRQSPGVENETTALSPTARPEATLSNFLPCQPQRHEREGPNHSGRGTPGLWCSPEERARPLFLLFSCFKRPRVCNVF